MADQAKITSLDALQSFRASTIVFLTKARRALDQAGDEVRRTRQWVQGDQRVHWEAEIRRRRRVLDQAQGELMSARLSEFVDSPSVQQAAVRKARVALEEAEQKLDKVKAWNRNFDTVFDPNTRKMEVLREYLDHDMPKALAYLDQIQKILEGYSRNEAPPSADAAPESDSGAWPPTENPSSSANNES